MQSHQKPGQSQRTVGRAALWSALNLGAAQALSMLVLLVTARFVSAESFGILAVSLATVELFKRVFVEPFWLATASTREVTEDDYNACFILTLIFSVGIAAALAGSAPFIARLLERDVAGVALAFISLLLVTNGLSRTHEAWLSRQMRFKALALRSIGAAAAGGVAGVALAMSGFDLWALVGQQIVGSLVSLALLWGSTSWRPRLRASRAALKANLAASRSMGLGAIGSFVTSEADIYLASAFLGDRVAGIYNVAKRFVQALNMFLSSSIRSLAIVTFANASDRQAQSALLLRAVPIVSAIAVPCGIGMAVLAQDIVLVLLGDKWRAAGPILSALAAGASVNALFPITNAVLFTNKRADLTARLSLLTAVLTLLLLPISVRYGATALAIASTLVQLIAFPMGTWYALDAVTVRRRAFIRAMAPALASAAVAAAVLITIRQQVEMSSLRALLLFIPAGGLIYFGTLYLFDRRTTAALITMIR